MAVLSIAFTNEEKVLVTATPRTANRKAKPLDGPIVVTVVSGSGTFEMVSDSSFFAVSGADAGVTEYNVNALSGGNPLSNSAVATVTEAPAVELELVGDVPVPK